MSVHAALKVGGETQENRKPKDPRWVPPGHPRQHQRLTDTNVPFRWKPRPHGPLRWNPRINGPLRWIQVHPRTKNDNNVVRHRHPRQRQPTHSHPYIQTPLPHQLYTTNPIVYSYYGCDIHAHAHAWYYDTAGLPSHTVIERLGHRNTFLINT